MEKERRKMLEEKLNESKDIFSKIENQMIENIEGKKKNDDENEKEDDERKEQKKEQEEEDRDAKYDYAYAMREINEAAMEALTSGERVARELAERESKEMEAKVRALEIEMNLERKKGKVEKKSSKFEDLSVLKRRSVHRVMEAL